MPLTQASTSSVYNSVTIVETDVAGNVTLPSTPLQVIYDTATPPALATPTLAAFSDTGTFSNDNLTATTTPTFTGTATPWAYVSQNPNPTAQADGTLVQIYLQLENPTPAVGQPGAAGESRLPGRQGAGQSDHRRGTR